MATYERVDYGSDDGAQLGGAATDKVGFFGTTPAVQPSAAGQAALTSTTVTSSTPFGFVTATAASAAVSLLVEIRAALVTLGIIKGSS
jgi:hypothetical protein